MLLYLWYEGDTIDTKHSVYVLFGVSTFQSKFFARIKENNFNKTIFSNISKQTGENPIMPSGGGYLVTSRNFFKLGT